MKATWTTGYGTEITSTVLAAFTDNGIKFVVIPCGRSRYDVAEPYAVMRESDCKITRD